MNADHKLRTWTVRLLLVIAAILLVWAMKAAGAIIVPLIFGGFTALMIYPVDRRVTTAMPRGLQWLGPAVAMLIVMTAVCMFIGLLVLAAQQTASQVPFSREDLSQLFATFTNEANSAVGEDGSRSRTEQPAPSGGVASTIIDTTAGWASTIAGSVVSATGNLLSSGVLVLFVTLFALIEARNWRDKISSVLGADTAGETRDTLDRIARQLRHYLLVRTFLGLATGALYGGWLWLFGVDLLVVWMLLAFLLNFIPTLGSLVAGALPVAYGFTQLDFGPAFAVGTGILVIEQIMGNFVDPRVQGRQLSISPMVILIALLFWGWIWGVAGAVLGVPLMITALICLMHVPRLHPVALFISNARDLAELRRIAGN